MRQFVLSFSAIEELGLAKMAAKLNCHELRHFLNMADTAPVLIGTASILKERYFLEQLTQPVYQSLR